MTEPIVTVERAAASCEVTASPSSMAPVTVTVTVDPGTSVHVVPFVEVYAENVLPFRCTSRYTGSPLYATLEPIRLLLPPVVVRSSTTMPLPGLTNSA